MATHRFDAYTKSNPDGDDVGAEDARILDSGVLVFFNNGRVDVAYAAHEWVRFEYGYEEKD
jgi:hypothetical protein